jgi:hypothetical protein
VALRDCFPPLRPRAAGVVPGTVEKYERHQVIRSSLTAQEPAASIGRFSGKPDAIDLFSTDATVVFILRDRTGTELDTIVVAAGDHYETHIAAEEVFAARLAAGAATVVTAVGKWAERTEAGRGYR